MTDEIKTPNCPNCGSEPGVATASLAPNQAVCPDGECPTNSWQRDKRHPSQGPVGSYLPEDTTEQ